MFVCSCKAGRHLTYEYVLRVPRVTRPEERSCKANMSFAGLHVTFIPNSYNKTALNTYCTYSIRTVLYIMSFQDKYCLHFLSFAHDLACEY